MNWWMRAASSGVAGRVETGMAVSSDYRDFVLEQLVPLGQVTARRMFGGVGIYANGLFFALIDDDEVDEETSPLDEEDTSPLEEEVELKKLKILKKLKV